MPHASVGAHGTADPRRADARTVSLLVSVASAQEVSSALAGGADIIDAKDPLAGALGAVSIATFRAIHAAVAGVRIVTAALGDARDERTTEHQARVMAAAGATYVKVGFGGTTDAGRIEALIAAAFRGVSCAAEGSNAASQATSMRVARSGSQATPCAVIAVAYADHERAGSASPSTIIDAAACSGAAGVLLDTADKAGAGLLGLMTPHSLTRLVADAHRGGLVVALAGKLTAADIPCALDAGAEIVGVRGAACLDGRTGRIDAERVRHLRSALLGTRA